MDKIKRDDLVFSYFFNAGLDRKTMLCDAEGSDVYEKGIYIGSIYGITPTEISEMEDDEVERLLDENMRPYDGSRGVIRLADELFD